MLTDNTGAAYFQIRPEGGWMAASDVKKVAQFDLASLGFVTLDKAPKSFDLIDGIHHPGNVVKGILEQLYLAAQNETDSSQAMNQYNYSRLLKQVSGMVAEPWHMHPVAFLGAVNGGNMGLAERQAAYKLCERVFL